MTRCKLLFPATLLASGLLLATSLLTLMQGSAAAAGMATTPTVKASTANTTAVTTTAVTTTAGISTTASVTGTANAAAGKAEPAKTKADEEEVERPDGWGKATHSNEVDPDYAAVFPADRVNEITITISAENWAAMQADMTDLYGEKGAGRGPGGFGGPPMGGNPGDLPQPPVDGGAPADGQRPPGGMGGGMGDFTTENPIWVTSTVEFDGDVWTNVGIRYKGNSSLMSSWNSDSLKLPFKLDFDEFEDDYPAIDNQRFYGFQQLSFGNNFSDDAMLRDALAYDVYEAAGLVAANTGFYHVMLDYGEGLVDLGMYTAVEVIDDTVVEHAFGEDKGNLYEGDGRYVALAAGTTAEQIEESYQKENNEDEADWSDIQALYDALHSDLRTEDPAAWREALEAVFDVDTFLKWLAVSAEIGHWDTYGAMSHNYYLYDNPATGQLTWITWDHNMTFSGGMGGGIGAGMARPQGGQQAITDTLPLTPTAPITATAPATGTAAMSGGAMGRPNRDFGGPGGGRSVTLDKANVTDQWPLIRFLLDDEVYYARYVDFLAETSAITAPEAMTERIEAYAEILAPYAAAEEGAEEYASAVQRVIDYVTTRAEEVQTFLDAQ